MADFGKIRCETGLPMAKHTTFKVGGKADIALFPQTREEIKEIFRICKAENIPVTLVGKGSNLVVSDKGIDGAVIILSDNFAEIKQISPEIVEASAGVKLSNLCMFAMKRGLTGLEFAYGIPGTVGGAVFMNAGAYDGETAKVIQSVEYLTSDGEILCISAEDCDFGYRHSVFMDNGGTVLSARFKLEFDASDGIKAKMEDYLSRRKEKQPLDYPSAGSVFRRPEGYFAGALIEKSRLKGYSVGGAQVSEKHAGFIINKDNATAEDIKNLVNEIKNKVKADSGVDLECEIRFIGR